jgi:hypothetical protein
MARTRTFLLSAALAATTLAAGCGGSGAGKEKVEPGAVVYHDALNDNGGSWVLLKGKMFFAGGRYRWNLAPGKNPAAVPDALLAKHIPAGLAVSAAVETSGGAALRAVACREVGPRDQEAQAWYELGIDGRQALIRRMAIDGPPKVLARTSLSVPNGRRVRLTAECVPARGDALALVLLLDGRQVLRTTDTKPLPAARDGVEASPSLRAYPRPDSPSPAVVQWDDFEVRAAVAH